MTAKVLRTKAEMLAEIRAIIGEVVQSEHCPDDARDLLRRLPVRFSRAMGAAGSVKFQSRASSASLASSMTALSMVPTVLSISWPLYRIPENQKHLRDTILHECAHVIVGYAEAHGPAWQAKFAELGGSGNRERRDLVLPLEVRGRCLVCGREGYAGRGVIRKMRAGHKYACNFCGGRTIPAADYTLEAALRFVLGGE